MESALDRVLAQLQNVKPRQGGGYRARCPVTANHPNGDRHPSLDVDVGEDDKVLLICRSRHCSYADIMASIGKQQADGFASKRETAAPRNQKPPAWRTATAEEAARRLAGKRELVEFYVYQNANGADVGLVTRMLRPDGGKDMPQAKVEDGAWVPGGCTEPVLYRLPELLQAPEDALVLVAEGERKVDLLRQLGFHATCSRGGAMNAGKADWSPLAGHPVVILPDNNPPGEEYGSRVVREAHKQGPPASIGIVRLPGLAEGEDIVDWVAKRRAEGASDDAIQEQLERLVADAEPIPASADNTQPEPDAERDDQQQAEEAPEPAKPSAMTPAMVFARWRQQGAVVHLPTGIAKLDELTGGGLPFGSRVYVQGSPDAGKTALAVAQLADRWIRQGVPVFVLAIDEEPDDLLSRLMQRLGWTRKDCEQRHPADIDRMEQQVRDLPVCFYDSAWTIEAACADAAGIAAGKPAVFIIDSLQTARSVTESDKGSGYENVTARVLAIREMAGRHRFLMLVTCEMNRGAYRSIEAVENSNDMAAGKGTGAIEYSARILLSLRNLPGDDNLVELRITKNKHGRRHRDDEPGIVLRIDRARQSFEQSDHEMPKDSKAAAKSDRAKRQQIEDAAVALVILARNPGIGKRDYRTKMKAKIGSIGIPRMDVALELLECAIVKREGPGGRKPMFLVGSAVRPNLLAAVPLADRPAIAGSVPPPETPPEGDESTGVSGCVAGVSDTPKSTTPRGVSRAYVVGADHTGGAASEAELGAACPRDTPDIRDARSLNGVDVHDQTNDGSIDDDLIRGSAW